MHPVAKAKDVVDRMIHFDIIQRSDELTIELLESLAAAQSHADPERVAQLIAHRGCGSAEHDPMSGKLHGYCVVCLVPWPCEFAGSPPTTVGQVF